MELSKQFLKSIIQLQNAASKDEIRFSLCGVWWVDNTLYAANGYYGASIPVSYNTPNKVFFSHDDIKKIKFLLDQFKKIEPTFTLEGKTLSALGESVILSLRDDVPFIDIARVLDVKEEGKHVVSFNAEYLFNLAKAIGENKNNRVVKLYIDVESKLAPIVVKSEHTGVLMPCRS
jgi:hypothetical protein